MDGGELFLQLSDDGRGFNTAQENNGHGLASMRERAETLGGRLEVISTPSGGTKLTFTVPLAQSDADSTLQAKAD